MPSVIIFALAFILIGKLFFVAQEYFILYVYGVLITFVLLVTMYFALYKYKDPYITAMQKLSAETNPPPLPYVSFMVAVYNEAPFVERCIESIVSQSYDNKEVIFVNDCSTDNTGAILDRYADSLNCLLRVLSLCLLRWTCSWMAKACSRAASIVFR